MQLYTGCCKQHQSTDANLKWIQHCFMKPNTAIKCLFLQSAIIHWCPAVFSNKGPQWPLTVLTRTNRLHGLHCSRSSRNAPSNAWFSVSSSQFFAFVPTSSSFSNSSSFANLSRSAVSSLFCHMHTNTFHMFACMPQWQHWPINRKTSIN